MNRLVLRGRHLTLLLLVVSSTIMLAACGAASAGTPTAIPANIVQPVQTTPSYSLAAPRFRLETAEANPILITPQAEPGAIPPPVLGQSRASLLAAMLMNLPPSAMGIATGGGTILSQPNGDFVASVPAGGTLTVTGRSQDGAWLAVYTSDAQTGWMPAGSLLLLGDDDLTVVEDALSPAPVATMLADAMQPVALSMADVIATRAAAPATPESVNTPAAQTSVEDSPAQDSAVANANRALIGVVQTQGNLNLRAEPSIDSALVAALPPQSHVIILGRNEAGDWLRVRAPAGDGWLSAQFVEVQGDMGTLLVDTP